MWRSMKTEEKDKSVKMTGHEEEEEKKKYPGKWFASIFSESRHL
jgi:hypothetical protein